MKKLEKIPLDWQVLREKGCFKLVNGQGDTKCSLTYKVDKDRSGKKFIEMISAGSGREQGRGYYSFIYKEVESFAKEINANYLMGLISPSNIRSREIHRHFGFSEVERVDYLEGLEKRIRVRKEISI